MQSLKNGTQLGGYTLIRLIARGGMGEVYEAHQAQLQRRVALKVIAPTNPDEHDRDDLVRRFMQEARTLARVNHPHVVTIYSIEQNKGTPFIAMEYVEGCSFRQLIEQFTFTIEGALPLFLQMVDGLKSLHENKIVHRDLKPHNLLLRPDGQIKILDFGIAKHAGQNENTRAGVIVGTLPYMAPELKNGAAASARSDLWSLGAIFFECLTGKRLVECMPDGEIDYPAHTIAAIPPEMRMIIAKMCAHRPTDRYASADLVADDLRALQMSRPPVPTAVWNSLAKKVEALAEANRKAQDQLVAPSSPKLIPTVVLAKNGLATPDHESWADVATRVVPAPADAQRRKRAPANGGKMRAAFWITASLAALVAGAIFTLPARDGERPVKPTQTTSLPSTAVPPAMTSPVAVAPPVATAPPVVPTPPRPNEPLTLKEPSNHQLLWLEPTRLPTLAWSRPVNPGEYQIQIAQDAHFKKLLVQELVSGSNFRPERVLPEGRYYWRLQARGRDLPTIGVQDFTVAFLSPVELGRPDAGHNIRTGPSGRATVDFSWTCKSGGQKYLAQVANDPEFNSLVQEKLLSGCEWTGASLAAGKYFWRVRLSDAPGNSTLWSQARQLTLSPPAPANKPRARELSLAEPKAKRARQSFTLEFHDKPRDLASLARSLVSFPTLEWSRVKGATRYLLQISTSRGFNQVVTEETVSGTSFDWKTPRPGAVYWRVKAVAATSEMSNFSEPSRLEILLPAPQVSPLYKFKLPPQGTEPVSLEWAAVPLAAKYIVQYSARPDLSGAEEQLTKAARVGLSAKPAEYFVRVAAADESGDRVSAFSNTGVVRILASDGLSAPKLISPPSGARAPSKAGRISVVFSWSKVEHADGYTVEIASDPQFTQIIDRRSSKNRGTLLHQAELRGRVYWRVRATGTPSPSAWSEPSHFDVK